MQRYNRKQLTVVIGKLCRTRQTIHSAHRICISSPRYIHTYRMAKVHHISKLYLPLNQSRIGTNALQLQAERGYPHVYWIYPAVIPILSYHCGLN